MTPYIGILLLILGGILYSVGDVYMRFWLEERTSFLFTAGFLFYVIGLFFLAYSYLFKDIAIAGLMIVLFNTLFYLGFNYWYFGETISAMQWVGVLLAFAALGFLELS